MLDYGIMTGLLLFLGVLLAFQCKYKADGNTGFFDTENAKAMRGFWCMIVMLVHVPYGYQNRIQDMIGSFAYVGVTFFFMTSAYGLSLSARKKNHLEKFWRKRLPKLVFPNLIAVALLYIIAFILFRNKSIILGMNLGIIDTWVVCLLLCYFFFWISCFLFKTLRMRHFSIMLLVIFFSVVHYTAKMPIWFTEVYGFIWGILLCRYFEYIKKALQNHWIGSVAVSLASSLVAGVLYLIYKHVPLWGDYFLKIVLGLLIITFVLALNSKIQIGNKASMFLGEISYEIYLIHGSIYYFIRTLYPETSSGVFILISIILTILFALIVHYLSKKLLSVYYKHI